VVTALVFGLIPAVKGSQTDVAAALKEGGARGTGGPAHQRFRRALVVAEIALALVLLAGAGLFVRSFARVLAVDPGFDPRHLLTMNIVLDGAKYGRDGRSALYYQQLIERLKRLPSVLSAAAVTTLPMSDVGVDFDRPYWREGEPEPGGEADKIDIRMATPDYFQTMRLSLLRGRHFTEQDRRDTPAVIIVSDTLAEKVWPGADPIGQRLVIDYSRGKYPYEVVGLLRGARYYGLKSEPQPEVFILHAQNPYLPMNLVVRSTADPARLIKAVGEEVRALDPAQPMHQVRTMEQLLAQSVAPDRFAMSLLGVLAVIALALAGIYGVMSYLVSQRRHEIGVRLALGAQRRDLFKLVLGESARLALGGLLLGLLSALALTRLIASLLFGVSAADPATYAAVSLILVAVVLLASYLPARRAVQTDPMIVLRGE
jgi:predicted permease